MIEAGILGKPVFTIQTTEFEGGKSRPCTFITRTEMEGMLKLPGISSSTSISSAHRWRSQTQVERCRRFIASFVRPRGIDLPVAPIMVDEIERRALLQKPLRRSPLWHYPARQSLLAFLRRR